MDALLEAPLDDLLAAARERRKQRRARHLLAEGLHPADDALPRRLRLLHVRPSATARRARVPDRGRGARDRARRRGGRLHGGALHARRQAGAALQGRAGGARGARLRDDDRVPRPRRQARPRGDRPAAAPESGRDEPRRADRAAAGLGLDGDHARDGLRAALREGRPALGLAGQGACPPPRDDRAGRRAPDPVHERDPDRDRRDAGGAARGARGPARAARAARPPAGGDRAELPRQAGHPHGVASRAEPRRPSLDDRGGAPAAAGRRLRAGAAEPRLRRLPAPARRRHRRLGRRLARHDRPRQPRGALARPRPPGGGHALARPRARAPAAGLSRVPLRSRGSTRPCCRRR